MKKKNNVGRNSLIISLSGLIVIEILFVFNIISGSFWKVMELGFEAATVGGLADWFAVSALFREIPVPIPFIKKHTNIIVKNRKKLTAGASELVTKNWLSSESLKSKINEITFTKEIIKYFTETNSSSKQFAIDLIREILKKFTELLDSPGILEFLKKIADDQIRKLEISKPLGKWIKQSIEEGKQNQIWELLIKNIRVAINQPDSKYLLKKQINKFISEYRDTGIMKKFFISIAVKFKGLDEDLLVDKLLNAINEFLDETENNPEHEFRIKFNNVIIEFADGLIENKESSVSVIEKIKESILTNPDVEIIIRNAFSNLKETILSQLENNDTPLMKAIESKLNLLLAEVSESEDTQHEIDEWIRETLSELIDKYHHKIGELVIESMNKFDDRELVKQIEDKVGDDLQYIRLNGAIVGGAAGILIGVIKYLLLN
ncbi:MAG: DUF445 domain-containing protein [Ignavibacteria bacterium]|nr:DUF445 domain-containing protein [Ignavibacteria bacterium]